MKASIFIGSSSEALPLARLIKDVLDDEFQTDIWCDDLFALGHDTLDDLLRFVQVFDFAVLVLSDDDVTTSRASTTSSPRDNVIFELGLFMGALGRRNAFPIIVRSSSAQLKTPSDLLGNTAISLSKAVSLNPTLDQLRPELAVLIATIRARCAESKLQLLPSTGLAIGYYHNFLIPVCQELANANSVEICGRAVDIANDNFDFLVVLPRTLSDASVHGAKKFVKAKQCSEFTLKTTSRPYSFYVQANLTNGRATFYDYPTTLNASHKAIQIALSGPYLGASDHHAQLDAKEINNFARTLRILMMEPVAAEFRDNVKIIQAP
jgi:hypothetical protein